MRIASEREDARGFWSLGQRLRENDGGEAGVQDGVEVSADGVQGDEGIERKVGGQVEAELWIEEDGGENVKVGGVGTGVDVCRRWEDNASAFTFAACRYGVFQTVWRRVEGGRDCGAKAVKASTVGTGAASRCEGRMERKVGNAGVGDVTHWA
jgi:hypothetical protein